MVPEECVHMRGNTVLHTHSGISLFYLMYGHGGMLSSITVGLAYSCCYVWFDLLVGRESEGNSSLSGHNNSVTECVV